jgi:CBS domain-containing protein
VAEDVMVPGPVTVRADADLGETRARMQRRGVTSLLVTTPEGILLGELTASDGRRAPLQPEGPLAPH